MVSEDAVEVKSLFEFGAINQPRFVDSTPCLGLNEGT